MPPAVDTKPGGPGGPDKVSLDIERLQPNVVGDDKLRIMIELLRVDNFCEHGGTFKLVRKIMVVDDGGLRKAKRPQTLFTVNIPAHRSAPNNQERNHLKFVVELTMSGAVPTQYDANDFFALHWSLTGSHGDIDPGDYLVFDKPIP